MTQPAIGVLDYGSGNLHSVCQGLDRAGAKAVVSGNWDELNGCVGLVLPGVGAFAACMAGLTTHRARLLDWVGQSRRLLGICVGHQVLFDSGDEHGVVTAGLGLISGAVTQLVATRLPHMGWDTVEAPTGSLMFDGIASQRFYFVHSYAAHATASTLGKSCLTWGQHESDRFVAAIEAGPIWSTQFHPEKSGAPGVKLLENWLRQVQLGNGG